IYLMGSLHLCKKEIYPLDQAITQAYEESKFLALEADPSPEKMMPIVQKFIMENGLYMDGTSIKDHISEEAYKKVEPFFKDRGMSMDQMGKMRPWLLSLQIQSMEAMKLGLDPDAGLDNYFLNRSKKEGKELKEMESATLQLEMFRSFSDELQELALVNTLDEVADMEGRFKKMESAWITGNPKAMNDVLEEELKKEPGLKPYYAKLFDDRNVGMAAKIEEYLATGEIHFVIAGSGHIPGEKGILNLLKAKKSKSYKIEQLKALGKPEPIEVAVPAER
ncbi:MAG: TraB/GumN family protein, partial [Planctomycetota bacterium]